MALIEACGGACGHLMRVDYTAHMKSNDFYEDLRYCSTCRTDVRYLRAWEKAYCVQCQGVVSTRERRLRSVARDGEPRAMLHRAIEAPRSPASLDSHSARASG